jgi:ABC-2 type transport system ATP-binding protein
MTCAIRAEGLCKKFGRTPTLEDVAFEVPEGAVYALIGLRGSGKTTCLRILLNVLESTGGRAEVLGVDSRRLGPREFQQIGCLAAEQQMPEGMTVGQYLRFLKPYYPTWNDALATDLLRRFQLPLDRKLARLSEATRRKAALASTLAYRPRLMALDEPFHGLDPLARGELAAVLDRGHGATVLICAEDAAEVEDFATHIGWLDRGRLRLSEDLQTLHARCREIVITFHGSPQLPERWQDAWPEAWAAAELGPTAIRFIDTRFDPHRTPAEIRLRFPGLANVTSNPLPMAEILAALSQARRPQ